MTSEFQRACESTDDPGMTICERGVWTITQYIRTPFTVTPVGTMTAPYRVCYWRNIPVENICEAKAAARAWCSEADSDVEDRCYVIRRDLDVRFDTRDLEPHEACWRPTPCGAVRNRMHTAGTYGR